MTTKLTVNNATPITIDSTEYPSIRAASKALNIDFSAIRRVVMKNGRTLTTEALKSYVRKRAKLQQEPEEKSLHGILALRAKIADMKSGDEVVYYVGHSIPIKGSLRDLANDLRNSNKYILYIRRINGKINYCAKKK